MSAVCSAPQSVCRSSECLLSAASVEKLFAASANFRKTENCSMLVNIYQEKSENPSRNQNIILSNLTQMPNIGVFQQNSPSTSPSTSRYTGPAHGSTSTSPRRTCSRMSIRSGGSKTSTALPQDMRCQAISTQPLAVNSTSKLPSSPSVMTWFG